MMNFWKNIREWYRVTIKVPSPKDLGHSSYNALQSRRFQSFLSPDAYTWEDWEKEVKIRYPFRYFISETIPDCWHWFKIKFISPIDRVIYFIKAHTLKSHIFHIVDLRKNKSPSYKYKWGYLDTCEQILLANFVILQRFVEEGSPHNLLDTYTLAQIDAEGMRHQHDAYVETMELYNWWITGRKEEHDIVDALFDVTRDKTDEKVYRAASAIWLQADQASSAKDDEMLIRLIKIRRGLWD